MSASRRELDCALLRTAAYKLRAWCDGGPSGALTEDEQDLYMAAAIRAAHLLANLLEATGRDEEEES